MVYFVSALKIPFLLWALLMLSLNRAEMIRGRIPDLGIVSSFLEQFIRPYVEHVQINAGNPRATAETAVEKAIGIKVDELKPMLQDNEEDKILIESEENLALEGNDETTIIEFMPKPSLRKIKIKASTKDSATETPDPLQTNIIKYKKLRQTIKKVLDKEKTGRKTIKLIIRTLDEIIAQLIERRCTWQNKPDAHTSVLRSRHDTNTSINKLHKLTNAEWKALRKKYLKFLKFKEGEEDSFMKQFHDFFSNVINDTWNLSSRYKVRCQLVKLEDKHYGNASPQTQYLRDDKLVTRDQCDNFKVCSEELKEFLTHFYTYLNDTAVSTFRNYAAMYIRDVNVDFGLDKDIVVSVIENISNIAERKVSKIFQKELGKFSLDEHKKKGKNIRHLSDLINASVNHVKYILKKNLDHELGAMKTKLFTTVKDDLNVNLRVDMDNLGRLFDDRICPLFILCNGKYAARRQEKPEMFKPKDTDDIYVKVQLTFDDKFSESIGRSGIVARSWQGKDDTHRFVTKFKINESKYSNVSVTRTTHLTTEPTRNAIALKETETKDGGIAEIVNNDI